MARINMMMSPAEVILVMSGDDPDALVACTQIRLCCPEIDPDSAMGGLFLLMHLDGMHIWEDRIGRLWRDVCGQNIGKMLAVIRACQLGGLAGVTRKALQYAINNHGAGIDLDAVVKAVKDRLPRFNPEAATII